MLDGDSELRSGLWAGSRSQATCDDECLKGCLPSSFLDGSFRLLSKRPNRWSSLAEPQTAAPTALCFRLFHSVKLLVCCSRRVCVHYCLSLALRLLIAYLLYTVGHSAGKQTVAVVGWPPINQSQPADTFIRRLQTTSAASIGIGAQNGEKIVTGY